MLLGSASRMTRLPENDEGAEDQDDHVEDDAAEDEDQDDEQEDDLPEDGDEPDEEDEEPVRKPTRGENRVAAATRTAAEAKARVETLERELAAERSQRNQGNAAETERQERERLANMSAEDRLEYLINKQGRATEAQLAQIKFDNWDAADKLAFATKAASTPALRGLDAEVEAAVAQMRANGTNAPRETVAAYILGNKALAKMTKSTNAGAKKSAAGKERQGARPASGRGDVPADRSRGDKNSLSDLEKRLTGVKI